MRWLTKRNQARKREMFIKSFDKMAADIPSKHYRKVGIQSIEINRIIGSIGRAHDLDANFFYRNRRDTERHKRVEAAFLQGKPMQPIQVLKLERSREDTQYFVMDGHHRVAIAKKHGCDTINAEVTEVYGLQ